VPDLRLDDELTVHFEDDDFTDPWEDAEPIVLLHGLAESGAAWFAWVPLLARRFRVIRPDLRGFGGSSRPASPRDYPWSPAGFADDIARFLDAAGIGTAHVVGARLGSPVAAQLAADHPDRVRSLSLVSGLMRAAHIRGLVPDGAGSPVTLADSARAIEQKGVAAWAAESQRARIGSGVSDGQVTWWNELMAQADAAVTASVLGVASQLDLHDALPLIEAPTLVLAAEGSTVQPIEATREWASLIQRSRLEVLPGDSPHLAALYPEECAGRVLSFIDSLEA
jgi:pimeloyl-ACP methyl ester carboxylesterase